MSAREVLEDLLEHALLAIEVAGIETAEDVQRGVDAEAAQPDTDARRAAYALALGHLIAYALDVDAPRAP